ncbi:MAG: hypothetical protein EOQ42_12120 [Mesorhizobium sp.]|uniref:hypothetical protein n=1 Tax=Mesorhizobium sp. TaxID=1871066 RepID=UPI000FE4DC0F|nr:hypothetical protein [Mesorhizobium sp.]RWB27538.1 MAG: hypothetical protein EOQ43_26955 [Mesorhizobium sp.]RWB70027.1 MAG: hypothetical protein EOQ42_12120 [Mesorhizobium sp.]
MAVKIGDEVTLTVTILKVLDNGKSSVSIPSYSFPFSIDTPKRTKAGQKVEITGFVTRVNDENGKVTVRIEGAGLVTVDVGTVSHEPAPRVRQSR